MIEGHVALAIRNAAELTMSADMQRAAMIRNVSVDLDGLIRLEGVARRAVAPRKCAVNFFRPPR
jgi:hypothetical protein